MLRKLEKYELIEEIGHGGMATVYRARDSVLDREVALKVMHPHLRGSPEARRRFHREAQSVARLRHDRVLEIFDFSGEGSEEAFIAAELLTGPTLKVFRESQRSMLAELAACCAIEISRALEAAHEAGIVHRDVKPENVLLHDDRMLKLTDFGIADMVDAQSMTATGQILGSPGHMAPEQIDGRDCDARTDLFSLGTVLYYLATGNLPFTGRNPHQILKRIMDAEYADPQRLNPAIGGELTRIIKRSLAKEPDDRYQNAAEFRADLEAFVLASGVDQPDTTLAQYLKDPESVSEEIRPAVIARLIARGRSRSDAGMIPQALDDFNRVLALDEGNEEVMRLIHRVGQAKQRSLILVSVCLALFGLGAATLAWRVWPPGSEPVSELAIVDEADDAGLDAVEDGALDATTSEALGLEDAGVQVEATSTDSGLARAVTRVPSGPREVRLETRPLVTWVSVDGRPFQEHPSELRLRSLLPGRHVFRVEARGLDPNPYRNQTFTQQVSGGRGVLPIRLRLPYQNAGLLIRCRPACPPGTQVSVRRELTGSAIARGSVARPVSVPMGSAAAEHYFSVLAPDGAESSGIVRLRANRTETQRISLEGLDDLP